MNAQDTESTTDNGRTETQLTPVGRRNQKVSVPRSGH